MKTKNNLDPYNIKIMFVDDDPKIIARYDAWIAHIVRTIPGLKYINPVASDGIDHAISMIDLSLGPSAKSLDLIITDFDMPGTGLWASKTLGLPDNGNAVAKYASLKIPNVPVIGNTGGNPANFDTKYVSIAFSKIDDPYMLAGIIRSTLGISR